MRNILFSGNIKVFDGILTCMLSIFMRTRSDEPYRFYIFTMDVSHLRADFVPVSDKQIAFLDDVAKSYNKANEVIKIDVTDLYMSEFSGCLLARLSLKTLIREKGPSIYVTMRGLCPCFLFW